MIKIAWPKQIQLHIAVRAPYTYVTEATSIVTMHGLSGSHRNAAETKWMWFIQRKWTRDGSPEARSNEPEKWRQSVKQTYSPIAATGPSLCMMTYRDGHNVSAINTFDLIQWLLRLSLASWITLGDYHLAVTINRPVKNWRCKRRFHII